MSLLFALVIASSATPLSAERTPLAPSPALSTSPLRPTPEPEPQRAQTAPWTIAGASAAGFIGGALVVVPAMLSLPFGPLIGVAVGLPALALAAAFGAFVAALGVSPLSTSLAVSACSGVGALLGTSVGALSGWGLGSVFSSDVAAPLAALAGAALGGFVGAMTGGGLGALWLVGDER